MAKPAWGWDGEYGDKVLVNVQHENEASEEDERDENQMTQITC